MPPRFDADKGTPCACPAQEDTHTRLVIITNNRLGVLGEITSLLGKTKVNIAQQLNVSREDVALNVAAAPACPLLSPSLPPSLTPPLTLPPPPLRPPPSPRAGCRLSARRRVPRR